MERSRDTEATATLIDGAAAQLVGQRWPALPLPASDNSAVDLSRLPGRTVVFTLPAPSRPGEPPPLLEWEQIPGASGCTEQCLLLRELHGDFTGLGLRVCGLSTQTRCSLYQAAAQLALPFPLLCDSTLAVQRALRLPTFTAAGTVWLRRLALVVRDGAIERAIHPVPPGRHGLLELLAELRALPCPQ